MNSILSIRLGAFFRVRLTSRTWILLIAISSALLCIARFNTIPVGSFFYDDAHYIVLAESLATGLGYRLINFPHPQPPGAFPPGWPLLLAPAVSLFPGNFAVLKLVSLIFWLASIPLIYKLFATRLQTPYLEMVVAAAVLNPHLIAMSGTVMSESAYIFFSLLTLNLFESWNQDSSGKKNGLFIAVILVVLYTMLIRSIGLTLLLSILLYLLLARRFRHFMIITVLLLLGMLPLIWFNWQNGGTFIFSRTYLQNLQFISLQIGQLVQIWNYLPLLFDGTIANTLAPIFDLSRVITLTGPVVWHVLNAGVLLAIAGGFVLACRDRRLSELYVGLYLCQLYFWIAWAGHVQIRLFLPLIPFLLFYTLKATGWGIKRLPQVTEQRATTITLSILSLMILLGMARTYYDWSNPPRNRALDLSMGATWIREYTPADSIVMTADPIPDYLYARRRTVYYPGERVDIVEYIEKNGIDYVLIKPQISLHQTKQLAGSVESRLLPLMMSNPDRFRIVYEDPAENIYLYSVVTRD